MSGKELTSLFFNLLLNLSAGTLLLWFRWIPKISTLILKVDLECCCCYKKIRKTLCCLQEKVHITSISYDEKNGTVTVAGVFDPDRVSKKLRCRAGKVIKKIEEKKPEEKKKEEEKENKKEKKKEEEKENKKEKKEDKKEEKKQEAQKEENKKKKNEQEKKEEKKEKEKKQEEEEKIAEKEKPPKPGIKFEPVVVTPYFWPPGVAICCQQPFLESYPGGCRCCACDRVTENQTVPAPPASYPPAEPYYHPLPYKTSQFVSEEDPSAYCTVM